MKMLSYEAVVIGHLQSLRPDPPEKRTSLVQHGNSSVVA